MAHWGLFLLKGRAGLFGILSTVQPLADVIRDHIRHNSDNQIMKHVHPGFTSFPCGSEGWMLIETIYIQ